MVFQDARLVEGASALDNVLVCADARVDASSAAALLRLLVPGIDVHACVAELSGGQRRRVEVARALLCSGGAVILDEPFTGLDAAARIRRPRSCSTSSMAARFCLPYTTPLTLGPSISRTSSRSKYLLSNKIIRFSPFPWGGCGILSAG